MKIEQVLFSTGVGGFFFDDQQAIKAGAGMDGFFYHGRPLTPGFDAVRVAGESISIILLLEDGQVAIGDCAAVQYSGAGGRDPLFLAETHRPVLERNVRPLLEGREIEPFRAMAAECDALTAGDGQRLHSALQYGLSQALLDARARDRGLMPCEVLCEEYDLPCLPEPIPIFGQSGDDRYRAVDKMILKRVPVLPHGLINSIPDKLGVDGRLLREYVRWIADRLRCWAPADYRPILHIDVYGTLGIIFEDDCRRIARYLEQLEKDAGGLELYIEGPLDRGGKERQIEALLELRRELQSLGSSVRIVADEWCNNKADVSDFCAAKACDMIQIKTPDLGGIQHTLEAILICRAQGLESYQGGTCNETDVSARLCVHAAYAGRPQRILAKPGMGFDEGFAVVYNEMQRTNRMLQWRLDSKKHNPGSRGAP